MKFRLLATMLMAMCVMGAAAGAASLVDEGKAAARIIVPDEASKGELFAAQQIQEFVRRMSGKELAIVKAQEAAEGPAILIGNQPGNQRVIEELNKEHPDTIDAFAVVGKGDRLSVVGRSDTSTIWAAWQWLQDQGVVWVMPGEHGTSIPKKSRIDISQTSDLQAPGMMIRGGGYGLPAEDAPEGFNTDQDGVTAGRLFALRMRFNYNNAFERKDQFEILGSGHSYSHYLPASVYFKEHPEWFNLINGKRMSGDRGTQVCFTSEAGAAEFAKNVEVEIKNALNYGVPLEHIRIAVSPNDWLAMCECDNCKKLVDSDGSASSLVTHFCNLVTADIRKVYPEAITYFYAYDNYSTAPDHAKPGPGVHPEIVFWTSANSFAANSAHPMFSQANHKFRDGFAAWEKISQAVTAHTYYGHYAWFTPWPMVTQISHDIPHMAAEAKFQGMYSELHLHWGTQGLNLWLYPKLMWNPKLDVKQAIQTWCRAAYGPAAAAMQAYYQTVQEAMDRQGYVCGYTVEIPHVLTPEVISKVNELVSRAEQMLDKMDPDTRWRTELACRSWRASAQFAEAARRFVGGSGREDRDKILSLCDAVEQFARSPMGKWAFEQRIAMQSISSLTTSLKVDPGALPAGKQVFSDEFNYGGGIKFFAQIKGFEIGMWGYSLPVNGSGQIELPLKATAGHRITSARVSWSIVNPERFSGALSVVSDKGQERVLTTNMGQLQAGVEIPTDALAEGSDAIRLKLNLLSQYHDPTIALTGCRVEATVAVAH